MIGGATRGRRARNAANFGVCKKQRRDSISTTSINPDVLVCLRKSWLELHPPPDPNFESKYEDTAVADERDLVRLDREEARMVKLSTAAADALATAAKDVTAERLGVVQNLVDDHKETLSDATYKEVCDVVHTMYKLCCTEIPQCCEATNATSQRLQQNCVNWRYMSYALNDQIRADRKWAESVMDRLETFVPRE